MFVIALSPNPVEKLSILTDIARINKPYKDILYILGLSLNISIRLFIAKKIRTIPSNNLLFNCNNMAILLPREAPASGIIKCNIPTIIENNNILFLEIFKLPMPKHKEKVSIDKDTPNTNRGIIVDT